MLTQDQITPYLLRRELIDPALIVAGDLRVVDTSRRNSNFKVISTQGPCYLIKQGSSPDRAATVAHEAETYRCLQLNDQPHLARLSPYLPHFYGYDTQEQLLLLELVRDGEDLRQYQTRQSRFSTHLASLMGKALGTLHSLPELGERSLDLSLFADRLPGVLAIHRPRLWIFQDASAAVLQLIRLIQRSSEFCQLLDDLRQDWQADRLIHFDIKWDNWIIFSPSAVRRKTKLKLVDWELAHLGDPCWDVGSVFSSYLSLWLSSIPMTGEDPPERFLELARFPLEQMQPALRSFWASYIQQMRLDASLTDRWLLKAVRYAAARLVQSAFEQLQMSSQLTSNVVCLLQFSLNLLKWPHEAAASLLGLPYQQRRIG